MTSSFNVRQASGYEQLMGRWSRQLAVPFIDFAGLKDGEKILDVGCGTGSLTFALPKAANIAEVAAIDYSRKAVALMKQNIWLAVGYNALAVPVAILGLATPLVAAAAMSGSSVLVMLNAMRARRAGSEVR